MKAKGSMSIPAEWDEVLMTLEAHRALLLGLVAEELTYTVPIVAVYDSAPDFAIQHQRQMLQTTERFHDTLQAARLDWELVVHEFRWSAATLPQRGITHKHLLTLIATYFAAAFRLHQWSSSEERALEDLSTKLYELVLSTYPKEASYTRGASSLAVGRR